MTEKTDKTEKPAKGKKKDVDALLNEVTGVSTAKKAEPKPAPQTEAKAEAKPQAKPQAKPEAKPQAKAEARAEAKVVPRAERKPEPSRKTITIRQIRSGICTPVDQKAALRGLGLRRIRHEVVRQDTPSIRGQILKVRHLVAVVGE